MRILAIVLFVLALPRAATAQDARADAEAFLANARKAHLDLPARGLTSFAAEVELRRSAEPGLAGRKELATFGYAWTAPAEEKFDFAKTHESLRKPLRDTLRNLWRDLTGALWFDVLASMKDLRLEPGESETIVAGTIEKVGEVRAAFDTESGKLSAIGFAASKARAVYSWRDSGDGFQVSWREVQVNGKRVLRTFYRVFRRVNGFHLPTVLVLETEKNTTEYAIRYRTVNGQPARPEPWDPEEVKDRIARFNKEWRGWSEAQKIGELRELAEIDHDDVAAAIAKRGLRDASPAVRAQAAEALGIMKRRNVVPALVASLKKNEDEIDVYLRLILALGEIGDPRAVDALAKDWWNQRIGEYGVAAAKAKIRALGNIRHASAVDALIDTFFMTKDEMIAQFKDDLVASLAKLTGQSFRYDRHAWKKWWKANRAGFEFD